MNYCSFKEHPARYVMHQEIVGWTRYMAPARHFYSGAGRSQSVRLRTARLCVLGQRPKSRLFYAGGSINACTLVHSSTSVVLSADKTAPQGTGASDFFPIPTPGASAHSLRDAGKCFLCFDVRRTRKQGQRNTSHVKAIDAHSITKRLNTLSYKT